MFSSDTVDEKKSLKKNIYILKHKQSKNLKKISQIKIENNALILDLVFYESGLGLELSSPLLLVGIVAWTQKGKGASHKKNAA